MVGPDLNSLDLQNEVIETDNVSAEDFFRRISPIDDGEHIMTAKVSKKGTEIRDGKNKQTGAAQRFVMVQVQLTDTDDSTQVCFDNPNSVVFVNSQTGRRTSMLHVFLDAIGSPAPTLSPEDLKAHAEQALTQNPKVKVKTQWEAQYRNEKATVKKDEYVTFLKGQAKFPFYKDADGNETAERNPEVDDPRGPENGIERPKCIARAQVVSYKRA